MLPFLCGVYMVFLWIAVNNIMSDIRKRSRDASEAASIFDEGMSKVQVGDSVKEESQNLVAP